MDAPKEMSPRADLRDYLAAERTFLAWIRTGLALMGFGFVCSAFWDLPERAREHPTLSLGKVIRTIVMVRRGTDRQRGDCECFCRMAPHPAGPGTGSR